MNESEREKAKGGEREIERREGDRKEREERERGDGGE